MVLDLGNRQKRRTLFKSHLLEFQWPKYQIPYQAFEVSCCKLTEIKKPPETFHKPSRDIKHQLTCPFAISSSNARIGQKGIWWFPGNRLVCPGSYCIYYSEPRGRSRRKHHCGLRMKALMQGLGTRPDWEPKILCNNWENIVEIETRSPPTCLQINNLRFSPCAITTAVDRSMKLWYLSQTDFPIYRPRLSSLKPKYEPVELWLANNSL